MKQPRFAKRVRGQILGLWPKAVVTPLTVASVWGAILLAKRRFAFTEPDRAAGSDETLSSDRPKRSPVASSWRKALPQTPVPRSPDSAALSTTEQRNPRSMNLSGLPLSRAIALMLSEEANVASAVLAERKKIERAIQWIVVALKRGGRLFYVGAGTSGRLGVLDASECPPTFRASSEQVQGIIAGGQQALWASVEGAEDDGGAGKRAIQFRGVGRKDVVVGIAASGRTPFVWGALSEAKKRGAATILVCFNPHLEIPTEQKPNLVICPNVGPEVLTGSTRLKAGTATKLILNILTTLSMVRLGKVVSNLMVDLAPTNMKLRDRAVRIVRELTGADYSEAQMALEKSGWIVKSALARFGKYL